MAHNTQNFHVSEFTCKCGCGYNVIDQHVINIAQLLRDFLGVPVRVNSGCRCEKHNARVGGVKGSFHTKGLAADLSSSVGAIKMFEDVKKLKETGQLQDLEYCILYKRKNFIHIDCGKKRNNLFEVRL